MKWSYVWKNRTRKKYEEAHSGYIINFLPAKTRIDSVITISVKLETDYIVIYVSKET